MLIPLDESLHHQVSQPFAHVGTSDHRFYDRYYIECADPGGSAAVASGLAVYKNSNVIDGFLSVVHADRQHNVRVSKAFRSDPESARCGPLGIEVVRPFEELHWTLAPGDHGIAADITWRARAEVVEERPHFTRTDGRVAEDIRRYNQAGRATGWVEIGATRLEIDEWWAARDHSWGVRQNTGGFEPKTRGVPPMLDGFLYTWLAFSTEQHAGYIQVHEERDGTRVVLDGAIHDAADGRWVSVGDVGYEFAFPPGSRNYEAATITCTSDDGRAWEFQCARLLPPYVMRGTGYDSGYRDGLGLGAYRGDSLLEHDVLVLDGEDVTLEDTGETYHCFHREQLVSLTVNGVPGTGHFTVLPVGELPKYGIPGFTADDFASLTVRGGR